MTTCGVCCERLNKTNHKKVSCPFCDSIKVEKSLNDISKVLDLEPRHFGALSGQGLIRISLKDWSGAIEVLEEGLKINPHMLGAIMNLKYARKMLKESMT